MGGPLRRWRMPRVVHTAAYARARSSASRRRPRRRRKSTCPVCRYCHRPRSATARERTVKCQHRCGEQTDGSDAHRCCSIVNLAHPDILPRLLLRQRPGADAAVAPRNVPEPLRPDMWPLIVADKPLPAQTPVTEPLPLTRPVKPSDTIWPPEMATTALGRSVQVAAGAGRGPRAVEAPPPPPPPPLRSRLAAVRCARNARSATAPARGCATSSRAAAIFTAAGDRLVLLADAAADRALRQRRACLQTNTTPPRQKPPCGSSLRPATDLASTFPQPGPSCSTGLCRRRRSNQRSCKTCRACRSRQGRPVASYGYRRGTRSRRPPPDPSAKAPQVVAKKLIS